MAKTKDTVVVRFGEERWLEICRGDEIFVLKDSCPSEVDNKPTFISVTFDELHENTDLLDDFIGDLAYTYGLSIIAHH